ncbi:TPA: hypothetical protein KNK83_003677 [Clostridioides difficile]|nr:hypothetical protein [Clostridioides difficile]
MTAKLTDNASLRELITAFECIQNDLQTSKNNIVNAIGNPANLNDKLSIIPSKITTVLTEKNNTISQLSKFKYAHGILSPAIVGGRFATNYFTNVSRTFPTWININNLSFKPNLVVAEREFYDSVQRTTYKLFLVAYCGLDSTGNGGKGKDFVMTYKLTDNGGGESGNFFLNNTGDVWFKDNSVQLPAYITDADVNFNYKWHAIKVI